MNRLLASLFVDESSRQRGAYYRYGFLAIIIGLIVMQLVIIAESSSFGRLGKYGGLIVPGMMLFSHLAYDFKWPLTARIAWRVFAWVWLIAGSVYLWHCMLAR